MPRERVSTVKKDADFASGRTDPSLTNEGTIGAKEDPGRGSVSLAVPSAEREGSATRGNHGDAPRAEHAATQECEAEASQYGQTLLQPTVVEISAAMVDKAKAGEHDLMEDLQHSIADVGGSPPSVGRGRRRQRRSDGEEEYDTTVPGDINTRSKRRQTTGGADDAGDPDDAEEEDEGDAGDEEEADEEEDAEEEEDEEDAEENADVGEEEKDENDDEEDEEEEEEDDDEEGGDEDEEEEEEERDDGDEEEEGEKEEEEEDVAAVKGRGGRG
ncbi:unnamed protein product [Closterium sp. Naga37s-1]|nr:unnamed protein product [Closterium sp. Naga37s-1]